MINILSLSELFGIQEQKVCVFVGDDGPASRMEADVAEHPLCASYVCRLSVF